MNESEFIGVVLQMRLAQKEYFSTRSKYSLQKAKGLERRIDKQLDIIYADRKPVENN